MHQLGWTEKQIMYFLFKSDCGGHFTASTSSRMHVISIS